MANSDSRKPATDQNHESYAEDAKARRVLTVDNSGNVVKVTRSRENLAGSAGTGSDGDTARVFTLTTASEVDIVEVFLDGVLLVETNQYSVNNTLKTVTMVSTAVWNSQILSIFYYK